QPNRLPFEVATPRLVKRIRDSSPNRQGAALRLVLRVHSSDSPLMALLKFRSATGVTPIRMAAPSLFPSFLFYCFYPLPPHFHTTGKKQTPAFFSAACSSGLLPQRERRRNRLESNQIKKEHNTTNIVFCTNC